MIRLPLIMLDLVNNFELEWFVTFITVLLIGNVNSVNKSMEKLRC